MKTLLQRDLQELEESISPEYQEIASDIPGQKVYLIKNSEIVIGDKDIYGDALHREIDIIINTKSDLKEQMKNIFPFLLHRKIKSNAACLKLKKTIDYLKELFDSKIFTLFLLTNPEMQNSEHYLLSFQFHYQALCLQK